MTDTTVLRMFLIAVCALFGGFLLGRMSKEERDLSGYIHLNAVIEAVGECRDLFEKYCAKTQKSEAEKLGGYEAHSGLIELFETIRNMKAPGPIDSIEVIKDSEDALHD